LKDVDNWEKYTAYIIRDEEEAKGEALTSTKQASSTKHQVKLYFTLDCDLLLCSAVSI
jgi:hypothetical protein